MKGNSYKEKNQLMDLSRTCTCERREEGLSSLDQNYRGAIAPIAAVVLPPLSALPDRLNLSLGTASGT